MKKIALAFAFLASGLVSQAEARVAAPLWTCKMSAQVQDNSFSLIVGLINVAGKGRIRCTSVLGQRVERPMVVQIIGFSVGPDISLPTGRAADLDMLSAAVGVSSVDAMYGEYNASFGLTAHAGETQVDVKRNVLNLTPRLPNGGISTGFSIAITQGGQFGLGINKNITGMRIMTPAQAAAWSAQAR